MAELLVALQKHRRDLDMVAPLSISPYSLSDATLRKVLGELDEIMLVEENDSVDGRFGALHFAFHTSRSH